MNFSVGILLSLLGLCLSFGSVLILGEESESFGPQTPTPASSRNTEWLEETIDQFLQQAENNGEPIDIQVSTCKISNQQLVATAQATIARALKGFCKPNEFEDKFNNLEAQLGDQLNVIKTMLMGLESKLLAQDREIKQQYGTILSLAGNLRSGTSNSNSRLIPQHQSFPPYTTTRTPSPTHRILDDGDDDEDSRQEPEPTPSYPTRSRRLAEITKYNSTLWVESGKRVFTYYWLVDEISFKLANWGLRRHFRSPSFYTSPQGYKMYLKIIPRSGPTTTYVHTGITQGDWDESLSWPFTYKLRISILSHQDTSGDQDLKSRLWDPRVLCSGSNWSKPGRGHGGRGSPSTSSDPIDNPECLGLGFPHDVLKSSGDYIQNDQIVIKLAVYLD